MSTSQSDVCCDYCSLPVPRPLWGRAELTQGEQYCCLGCRIAHTIVQERGDVGANRATLTRLGLAIFFSMNVMVFTFALWAYDLDRSLTHSELAGTFASLLKSICLLMSLPVLLLLGGPLAGNAWDQVRRRTPSTDLLILIAVLAAYGYSAWSVWTNSGSLYVETGCVTLVFLTLGRWLEATGRLRSTESMKQLEHLLPEEVQRVRPDNIQTIKLSEVNPGDVLLVGAGERIPADGSLCSRSASVDEQLITGECWPVERNSGESLVGGTLNLVGQILVKVTAPPHAGTLGRLVEAVHAARLKRGPYQQLAERITRTLFPVVVLVSLGAFVGHGLREGFAAGLLSALSVLLIACPCALGIATPLAVWVSMGTAARRGIVIQSGESLERLASAKAMRFDKTGTLTTGTPRVRTVSTGSGVRREDVIGRALYLAGSSTHIFSQAILKYYQTQAVEHVSRHDHIVSTVAGRGVYTNFSCEFLPTALGNEQFVADLDLEIPDDLRRQSHKARLAGYPIACLGWGGNVTALFVLEEQIRPEAVDVISECRNLGLDLAVLTGDHAGSGRMLSNQLGVEVKSELSPERKIQEVQEAACRNGSVVMVGDGLNDAGACSAADVGVAMGCGADVTRNSAGVCLVSNELRQIPWLIQHARRTVTTIRSNLFWSFAYNSIGITLAAAGWLHPAVAAVLMVGSSLYVIGNSLLLASDIDPRQRPEQSSLRNTNQVGAVSRQTPGEPELGLSILPASLRPSPQ